MTEKPCVGLFDFATGYGNTGCGVFKGRIPNQKGFWLNLANCIQMKSSNFDNWGGVKKSQNLTFKVNLLCQNHRNLSDFFFIEEHEIRSTFFVIDNF